MKTIIIIFIVYIILFGGYEISFKRNGVKREFKYNAVIWVLLDRYTIKKYKSDDTPMKLFTYRKFKRGISLSTAISKDIGELGTKEREEFEQKVIKEIKDWGL